MSGGLTRGIDSTLLWALRIVGLLLLAALVVVAVKFLVLAILVPLVAIILGIVAFAVLKARRAK